ncbi:MAG TPA: FUSC family protein [Streptosporangiaceae bacterium]|jgi:uncharacterized membrane protein YccC
MRGRRERAAPESLLVLRDRVPPAAATIARLTGTAVLAYVIASWLPGEARPLLAPLTALLVLQVSLYQTLRFAAQRVASVVIGVLVAVGLSSVVGFTWWSLGLSIAAALTLGYVFRLSAYLLEVPISAMLILSLGASRAATFRILDTLIGAIVGLVASLVVSPVRVEPAEDAVQSLAGTMSRLLTRMADGLAGAAPGADAPDWLAQARKLGAEIQRVERALGDAEDSIRLNPRGVGLLHAGTVLRNGVETLERAAITVRGLTRSLADAMIAARDDGADPPSFTDPHIAAPLSAALRALAAATYAYGDLVRTKISGDPGPAQSELTARLRTADEERTRLAEGLRERDTTPGSLDSELVVHLSRLIAELWPVDLRRSRADQPASAMRAAADRATRIGREMGRRIGNLGRPRRPDDAD